jgi:predicted alpha/beta hydrolase family esterase
MVAMAATPVLIVPGLGNSGPEHWQSLWEAEEPGFRRVEQRDWETPDCREWVLRLEETAAEAGPEAVIAAHSLGCATVAHWALQSERTVRGAFLVAPSDVEAPWYREAGLSGFDPMPLQPLPFPSLVVASSNDPYLSLKRAREFARAWGSRLVEVGDDGHLNTASGHGPWPEGRRLFGEWLREL